MENVASLTKPSTRLGQLWFKYRSFSPLPVLAVVLLVPPFLKTTVLTELLFITIMFLGEAIRVWAVGYAGSITRTRSDNVGKLVIAGPFRYVRNPLYIANIIIYVACAALFGLGPHCVWVFAYFAIQYSFIVNYEETILRQTFGESFGEYCAKVSRWIPSIFPVSEKSSHEFDLRASLRSERSTFFSLLGILTLFYLRRFWLL